jgi:hypothetical protein
MLPRRRLVLKVSALFVARKCAPGQRRVHQVLVAEQRGPKINGTDPRNFLVDMCYILPAYGVGLSVSSGVPPVGGQCLMKILAQIPMHGILPVLRRMG